MQIHDSGQPLSWPLPMGTLVATMATTRRHFYCCVTTEVSRVAFGVLTSLLPATVVLVAEGEREEATNQNAGIRIALHLPEVHCGPQPTCGRAPRSPHRPRPCHPIIIAPFEFHRSVDLGDKGETTGEKDEEEEQGANYFFRCDWWGLRPA